MIVRVALAAVLLLVAARGALGEPGELRVGSKTFTESVVLGEMVTLLAESTGAPARHRAQLGGTRILWNSLLAGEIDVYPEYTGTMILEIFAGSVSGPSGLRERLAELGLGMTRPLGFNNTYAIGVLEGRAHELGIEAVSDLVRHPSLKLAFSNEFMERADGWPGLREAYALPHRDVRGVDHDIAYRGLAAGKVDVIDLYATDAEIEHYGIRVLEDTRAYFTRYDAVLVYRAELEGTHPGVMERLRALEGSIDEQEMAAMNARVKLGGRGEGEVASEFLARKLGIDATAAADGFVRRLARNTLDHLLLVLISLSAAIIVAIPLGVAAFLKPSTGQVILGAAGVVQTIPALALLVFMIPLFGIGTYPAIAALFLYSILPIVRNTHSGLADIPQDLRESAAALGLPRTAVLRLVELPLAARSIMAGIKTSAVINIGTATLGALIGAGGYGQPILTGIRLDNTALILEGAVPAALLAVVVQWSFERAERLFVPPGGGD